MDRQGVARILVTGASGYLGSRFARKMQTEGARLCLLLRQSSKLERLGGGLESSVLRFASYAEAARIVAAFRPDIVLHAACNYGRAGESLATMVEDNYLFGAAVLEGSIEAGARAFINIGTPLPAQQNFYALTKAQFTALARSVPRRGMKFINIELQTMYGPDDSPTKFTTFLVQEALAGRNKVVMSLGRQLRDFIYIDDVISALMAVIHRQDQLLEVEDIDLGSGISRPLIDFAKQAMLTAQSDTQLDLSLPYRPHEPMEMRADVHRLQSLGWRPEISMEEGIQRMVDSARSSIKCSFTCDPTIKPQKEH